VQDPTAAVLEALTLQARHDPGAPIVIGCSGGPDSLALVTLAASLRRVDHRAAIHACIVDHGVQPDSADVASTAAQTALALGADIAHIERVKVLADGRGFEAAARDARRTALMSYASAVRAPRIWLAHTLDDQAETVLLGLARGSGARSLAGMRGDDGTWLRPLLRCRREAVHVCLPADTAVWRDPHNDDPRFLRSRVRHELMPALGSVLGDKAIVSLARTAELLRLDDEALSAIAVSELERARTTAGTTIVLNRWMLRQLPPAVMHRVFRLVLEEIGCPLAEVTSRHYQRISDAVMAPMTVGPLAMPGVVSVLAADERLAFTRSGADS